MTTMTICRGLPASGKTTWALEWLAESPTGRVRVNRDDIRFMLFGRYSGVDEALVTSVQTSTIKASMTKKLDIVVDNTNLNINHREKLIDLATRNGYKVVIKDFDVSVEDCIWRDMFRDKSVGEEVIRRMHKMYLDQR